MDFRSLQTRRARHAGGVAAMLVVATALFGGISARAATSSAAGSMTVGSVDIQKVLAGYNHKSSSESDFQKVVDQYDATFKLQQANYMLSSAEQTQLGTLLLKATPTPADQAQIKTLQTKSQNDAAELTALQQKHDLTDADKARLSALTQEQQSGQQTLQTIADGYKSTLDDRNRAESQKIADEVKAAVAAVAQQKGLTVVFDSSLAIYATNDVTQLVLSKLNGAAK